MQGRRKDRKRGAHGNIHVPSYIWMDKCIDRVDTKRETKERRGRQSTLRLTQSLSFRGECTEVSQEIVDVHFHM